MTDNESEVRTQSWHQEAFFRTYWFWGLVVVSFLMAFSEAANFGLMSRWTGHDVSYLTFTKVTYFGMLVGGLLPVYFLRTRLKKSLVLFTLVYLLSLILLRLGSTIEPEIYLAAIFFKNIGYFGIILTIVAVLVTAKLHLKSFLIAVLILWFWKSIGESLGGFIGFTYSDFENQILGFHHLENEGDIKPSVQKVFIYFVISLLPAVLCIFAAVRLNSKKLFEQSILKTEVKPALPLKIQPSGWLWQDLVSSYRFWGLVLISFLIDLTGGASLFLGTYYLQGFIDEYGQSLYTCIAYAPAFIAGLLTLYFMKGPIKIPLIGFSLLFVISLALMRFGLMTDPISFVAAKAFRDMGQYGVALTILSALVSAKLPLKSFLVAFFIIWFWSYLGQMLGHAYGNIHQSYTPIDDKGTPPKSFVFYAFIVPLLPAAFAILATLKLKAEMFFNSPDIRIEATPAKARQPVAVFFSAVIVPFYFLYWLFKQPGELKTIAPDMHQPSPRGVLCVGLFASLILPMWFYDVRKGLSPVLKDRSARRIAVVSFFSPAVAAAMAQSDYNKIANEESDTT